MTLVISLVYYILLILMFFTRVADILPILVSIGVFIIITIEYMKIKNESTKTTNINIFIYTKLINLRNCFNWFKYTSEQNDRLWYNWCS